jgi:hypothetical protein
MIDRDDPKREPLRDPNESNVVEYRSTPSREVADRLDTDLAAETVGGMTGTLGGAAVGSLAGPIGAVIGAIAGAIGGWWVGHDAAETASNVSMADEHAYRAHFESIAARRERLTYDDTRAAYMIGHLAGRNPEYHGQSFEQVEPELERGWTAIRNARIGQWRHAREYARYAFLRAREQ